MIKRKKNQKKISYSRHETRTKWKIYLSTLLVVLLFLSVGYKSLDLQVLNRDKAFRVAERQHNTSYNLLPIRGSIYDRKQRVLATNKNTKSIYINPEDIEDPESFAKKIHKPLDISYKKALSLALSKRSFVWAQRLASRETAEKIESLALKGINFIEEPKRVYPNDHLLGQTIGFTNIDLKGIEGIEYYFDGALAGKPRKISTKRDARGKTMLHVPVDIEESTKGNDLVLTIDSQIQYIVESELKKGVEEMNAESGMALLMDPETGEIRAMASYPFFNPNNFSDFPEIKRRNLPVWYAFEPGSTMKVFLLAAALEEKTANENSTYDCEQGRRKVGPKVIRDVHPYGILTFAETLHYSSNICASKIGEEIGKQNLYHYLEDFGFGEKLGVDLPGESSGLVQNLGNWGPVELATISFGQGISVTALQLVNALSTIANGGYQMQPYIVKKIINPGKEVITEKKPNVVKRVISYETSQKLKEILRGVVEKGTGENAKITGYSVAGKTGTAQIPDPVSGGYFANKYMASFMGFAPVDNPRLTMLVLLENPKKSIYGGGAAAPVFKSITEKVLFYMDVPTEQEYVGNSIMPNLEGKSARDILRWASEEGVEVSFKGNGFVVEQTPKPGETIKRGTDCEFRLNQDI